MKKFTILSTPKKWIKEWLADGTWTTDNTTSVVVQKDNGKVVQIFGAAGSYGKVGEEVALISDQTLRCIGYGKIIGYNKEFFKGVSTTYVFK